jgi:hypothetical protein
MLGHEEKSLKYSQKAHGYKVTLFLREKWGKIKCVIGEYEMKKVFFLVRG